MKLARRRNAHLSIAFIDLNNLKTINDSLGHDAGDLLITGAATTLKTTLRETDYVARVGGDEFLAVFLDSNYDDTLHIVERINNVFGEMGNDLMKLDWSMSIGVATMTGNESPEEFIKRADSEMYKAKQLFKSNGS